MNVKNSTMDLAFLARVRRTALIVGVIAAVPVGVYWGLWMAAAWIAGVLWSLVNLIFIGEVVKNVITAEDREPTRILVAVAVKFPVLYALGFVLLWSGKFPAAGLVTGFTWPFVVMVLKAVGRVYLGLDNRSNGEGKPSQA